MSVNNISESQELTPEIKLGLITKLGSLLHDEWREPRKKEDGSFEPRVKVLAKTLEGKEKWFDEAKVPSNAEEMLRQDIANTNFKDLDPHWQFENRVAAEVAMNAVFQAVENNSALDAVFVESASNTVHEEWLKRNSWVYDPSYGNPAQAKPYSDLSEVEKEKDRAQIRKAIEIFETA